VSLISITPFTDGAVLSTTTVNEMFDSFTEINGKLGSAHVTSLTGGLDHRHLQLGSTSGGTMVGGTANLDYFNGVRYYLHRNQKNNDTSQSMGYYDSGYLRYLRSSTNIDSAFAGVNDAATTNSKRPIPIPGASISFYLPFKAHVLVTWQVTWTSDAARFGPTPRKPQGAPNVKEFDQPNTAIRFFFDKAEHNNASTTRESREAMFGSSLNDPVSTTSRIPKHALRDRYKCRYWSGHAHVGVKTKGFHSASLRVCSMKLVRQTRVRVRNIKVVYFKT
tara:strand:+ start:5156 stop:5986 length:831 start_codon:yes stop_codon:yes gene_type:complete